MSTTKYLVSNLQVASRTVFATAGAILVLCGVVGKVGAVLAMIPDPIIGGTLLLGLGMVVSVGISGRYYSDVQMSNPVLLSFKSLEL